MIQSFASKDAEMIFSGYRSPNLPPHIQGAAYRKLRMLHAAVNLGDLAASGNRLEKLKGDRKGTYSIRVNDQYRICFEWIDGNANGVTVEDYH